MKPKENEYIIDQAILNYQLLTIKQKFTLNISLIAILSAFMIGIIYDFGEAIGTFIYNISH